jgi:hypothetical protein
MPLPPAAGKAAGDRRRRDVLAAVGSNGSGSSLAAAPAAPPKWYVTADELSRVPAYMKGRLTLDKVRPVVATASRCTCVIPSKIVAAQTLPSSVPSCFDACFVSIRSSYASLQC